ncbi:MAG: T9SS type A sorting domain-containing protein [Ignavibacteria bacterium]|nr:T9SS type A sorting domain-containing protein [Ignavibacteria bacterium]
MDIYNEPPMNIHTIYFYFDTLTLNIYGGEGARCPDSLGLKLAAGFKLPVGYIWNDCPMGAFFFSKITLVENYSGIFGVTDTLKYVERKDTIGVPIEGTTYYSYAEKFGYMYFYRGYGSPLLGGAYSKSMVGAVIDGVTYGSVLLDVTKISGEIPIGYNLEQNYPNPFNPSTVVKFSLPKSSFVTLKVYDRLGKEISTLANEKKSTGTYQYVFNAVNIPSGVYFYTLQSDDYIETKKMLLIK